jgi:hypothetical protein
MAACTGGSFRVAQSAAVCSGPQVDRTTCKIMAVGTPALMDIGNNTYSGMTGGTNSVPAKVGVSMMAGSQACVAFLAILLKSVLAGIYNSINQGRGNFATAVTMAGTT